MSRHEMFQHLMSAAGDAVGLDLVWILDKSDQLTAAEIVVITPRGERLLFMVEAAAA